MYRSQVMYHNQVQRDEEPTSKYDFVLNWLQAHEKYFQALPELTLEASPCPSPEATTTCLPAFQFLKKPGTKYFQRKPIPTPRVPPATIPTSSPLIVKTSNLTIQSNVAVNQQTMASHMTVQRPIQLHTAMTNQAAPSRLTVNSRPMTSHAAMTSRPMTSHAAEQHPIQPVQSEMVTNEGYVRYPAVVPPTSYRIPPCYYSAYTYDLYL